MALSVLATLQVFGPMQMIEKVKKECARSLLIFGENREKYTMSFVRIGFLIVGFALLCYIKIVPKPTSTEDGAEYTLPCLFILMLLQYSMFAFCGCTPDDRDGNDLERWIRRKFPQRQTS